MKKINLLLAVIMVFAMQSTRAEPVSNVTFGMSYYSGSDGTTDSILSNPGMGIQFLTGEAGKWLRTAYGAAIEMGSGTTTSLMMGNLLFGGELAPKNAQKLMPFVGIYVDAGWANFTEEEVSNDNGLLYGGMLAGGAEFKLKGGASNLAIRVQTSYRILLGSVGDVTGADLSAVVFNFGIVF
jgi:hypothetical protein